jgi:hypothetical protein
MVEERTITVNDLIQTLLSKGTISIEMAVRLVDSDYKTLLNALKMITHDTPNSSNIARLNYNPETGVLMIEFRSGKNYSYTDVPYEVFNQMTSADSVGKFFNSTIRPNYKQV